jgi:hypothetical protein
MATTLIIRPSEVTEMTPLGGNIDIDKILPIIYDVQITVIEPLLGTNLFNKIILDIENENLQGDYLILYNDYLKPILRHQIFAEYVEIASYSIDNGGIFKHQPTDSQIVDKSEVQYLAQTQRTKAQMYIDRAQRYLCNTNIPEFRDWNILNNKVKNIKVSGGWYLDTNNERIIRKDSLEY